MKAILKISGGIALIIVGIIGIILPIMPGWVFLIPGMMMVSDYCPPIKRLLDWGKVRFEKHIPESFRKKQQPSSPFPASDTPES